MRENPVAPPWRYAFEYELQFVGKDPESGRIATFDLTASKVTIPDMPWGSQERIDVMEALFTANITIDAGNIELRNREVHQTIDSALREINFQLEELVEVLKEAVDFEFALFLPAITWYGSPGRLNTTKHLNISYDPDAEGPEALEEAVAALQEDYPDYFGRAEHAVMIKVPEYSWETATVRLHIQLPYTFSDYEGLLEGTAELPGLKRLRLGKSLNWEKATLLGSVSKHGHWVRKSGLV